MLQKVFMKIHEGSTTMFYIESKNFNFSEDRVFDRHFKPIRIDKKLFERTTDLMLHHLHFPEDNTYGCDEYHIALGSMIETPEELLE